LTYEIQFCVNKSHRKEAVSKVYVIPCVHSMGEPRVNTLLIPWIPACAGKTGWVKQTFETTSKQCDTESGIAHKKSPKPLGGLG